MRALKGQRRVKEATRKRYVIESDFIEVTYSAIDWQSAKARFMQEFPQIKDFDIYVMVKGRGWYEHKRILRQVRAV